MPFELFDPTRDFRVNLGNLPHWYQPGVTYFVTFRTDDSLPNEVAELWHRRRHDWLRRHGINPNEPHWLQHVRLLAQSKQHEFHNTFSREFMESLDRGHGACALKHPSIAAIVATSLRHFDGIRYHLGDFVVMPNHVHLLVCLLGKTEIQKQCYSWKKYSATQINRELSRFGRFWQEESFDHLVRTADQFEYLRRYIAENPHAAKLHDGEYLYWRRDDERAPLMQ